MKPSMGIGAGNVFANNEGAIKLAVNELFVVRPSTLL